MAEKKRKAAVETAVAASTSVKIRPEVVVAIVLSLIECGRAASARYNEEGEAIQTAKASPGIKFSLPWTGTGVNMSLPQGQTVVILTRDPMNCMMYYDYNNGGAGGIAQVGNYAWQSIVGSNAFAILAANTNVLRPVWAINAPSAGSKAFHGTNLMAKTFGDRTYIQCDAPPQNADPAISKVVVAIPGGQANLQVGDIFEIGFFRLAEGADLLVDAQTFTLANTNAQNIATFVVPYTDKYRVQLNWTSLNGGFTQAVVTVTQTWACGTLCCNVLPQLQTIWTNLSRVRILGANVDIINQTPNQFRGGSVVAAQLAAGTTEYYALQGSVDPYAYISSLRNVEAVDMAKGRFGYLKPDGAKSLAWKKPLFFDGAGNITQQRSPALIEHGFVMFAVSAPDLVSGATTTTTRGQVTLDFNFSIEIDSKFNWLDYANPVATPEEWEAAEKAMAHIPQFWEDPDWGKIWSTIKSAAKIGANILGVIPDPRAQAISRGTNKVVDVLSLL